MENQKESEISGRAFIGVLAGIAAGVVGVTTLITSYTTVPAGRSGVRDLFGKVSDETVQPGLHFINPFTSVVPMDVRTKEIKESMNVPTKEGLMAGLELSINYRLQPEKAVEVYKTVGLKFEDVIVTPQLRNVTRDVVANYSSEDLYGSNRQKIASDITTKLGEMYSARGIQLEAVLLRDVKLPAEVTSAIERKISAKQASEQMQYVLEKETKESERKLIEAEGIAKAQDAIARNLTQEYLQWKYITTLHDLAGSPNTTFVITPYDQKLMPMLPLESKHTDSSVHK